MGTPSLDAEASELIALAAMVVSDKVLWTRHPVSAHRWKRASKKPLLWDDPERVAKEHRKVTCSAKDPRATEWTVLGALELVADDPNGPAVVRALDLLIRAGRGWTISRVEEQGLEWTLWTLATAITLPRGARLSPRKPTPRPKPEVDLRVVADDPPPTLRSSEVSSARTAA